MNCSAAKHHGNCISMHFIFSYCNSAIILVYVMHFANILLVFKDCNTVLIGPLYDKPWLHCKFNPGFITK